MGTRSEVKNSWEGDREDIIAGGARGGEGEW